MLRAALGETVPGTISAAEMVPGTVSWTSTAVTPIEFKVGAKKFQQLDYEQACCLLYTSDAADE